MASASSLVITPIGYITTPHITRADAPHQPESVAATEGLIDLLPGHNFEQALDDLEGIEKIWLIYWFDRNPNWKPKVLVPRGERQKRGVFATRSPYRPNPIGLSLVDLIEIRGLRLRVRNVDLLDGTPILDIKPYLPAIEAHADASAGWIDGAEQHSVEPKFKVHYTKVAEEQLALLARHGVELRHRIERVLSMDVEPHPYKRIERESTTRGTLAIRAWRVHFDVQAARVTIRAITSGYSPESLRQDGGGEMLSDDEAQRALFARWPEVES